MSDPLKDALLQAYEALIHEMLEMHRVVAEHVVGPEQAEAQALLAVVTMPEDE